MARDDWFSAKFHLLRRLGLLAIAGLVLLVPGAYFEKPILMVVGMLCVIPAFFWAAFIPVLHWRERYLGQHANFWGAFLVFETSGWSKLIYWFRHVLPDYRAQDRYKDAL